MLFRSNSNVDSNGNSPTFTGPSLTLPGIGITIPTLNEFNKIGIDKDKNPNINDFDGWYGGGDANHDTMQTLLDGAIAIQEATKMGIAGSSSNGFTITEFGIEWAFASYSAFNDIELYRNPNEGYYTLTIRTPLDEYIIEAWNNMDLAPISRDVTRYVLSTISSEPEKLFDFIYEVIYGDDAVTESVNNKFATVGDTRIMLDFDKYNATGSIIFILEPAN